MATILSQYSVADGYDVRCLLSNNEIIVFHFAIYLDNIQNIIDNLEMQYLEKLNNELENIII